MAAALRSFPGSDPLSILTSQVSNLGIAPRKEKEEEKEHSVRDQLEVQQQSQSIAQSCEEFFLSGGALKNYALQFYKNAVERNPVIRKIESYNSQTREITSSEIVSPTPSDEQLKADLVKDLRTGFCVGNVCSTMIISDRRLRGFAAISNTTHDLFFQILYLACHSKVKVSPSYITTEEGEDIPQQVSDLTAQKFYQHILEESAAVSRCDSRILDMTHPGFPNKIRDIIYNTHRDKNGKKEYFDILDIRLRDAGNKDGHAITILLHPQYQIATEGTEPITFDNPRELLAKALGLFSLMQNEENKKYAFIDFYKRKQMAPTLNPFRLFPITDQQVP